MQATVRPQVSAAEFERLYTGKRAELRRGQVREYMPAGGRHGLVAVRIGAELAQAAQRARAGVAFAAETGFVLQHGETESVMAPDAAFVRYERLPEEGVPSGFCRFAPDLAVEVVSPNDSYTDVREKVGDWLAGGVQAVWVVDPQRRTVEVWRADGSVQSLTEDAALEAPDLLPDFRLLVRDLFRD
ncbi:MAG: Uma2 family endonuclease [Fimbriimonadales bacterium]|nr:Uma2 family endonuclease [Fimbriimonadales bacterium]